MLTADFEISEADFRRLCDVVYRHCGISLNDEKKTLVRARIAKQLRASGFASAREYLKFALADCKSDAFRSLIDAISTNLTSFFRESSHFDFLSSTVLPDLLRRKRDSGDCRILGWSAACSSGEEPYSMAITILDTIDRAGAGSVNWDVRILATDISTRMLAAARGGIYPESRLSAVPPLHRGKYFAATSPAENGEARYTVSPELARIVRCRHLNLMEAWPFKGPFDFIFCRNVMIYFDRQTQQKLVGRYWNYLRPGGFLFTGHSESLTGIAHRFVNCKPSIYEKKV